VTRFQIQPPEKGTFAGPVGSRLALSPDGHRLAFLAQDAEGHQALWVRSLDSLDAHLLPGTERANSLFWSPDSRWIGFSVGADRKLRKIEASGGPPQTLCGISTSLVTGTWNMQGDILFGLPGTTSGLFRVSQAGGEVSTVTTPDPLRQETGHFYPQFLPDGRHFIYLVRSFMAGHEGLFLGTLAGKDRKLLLRATAATTAALYVSVSASHEKDYLLFLRDGALMAQPMNGRTFELAGDAFPVAERVGSYLSYGYFSASDNGVLAYRSGAAASGNARLTWFDREGKSLGPVGVAGIYTDVALSPDGNRAAVSDRDPQNGNVDISLVDLLRGARQRFTFDPALEQSPVWSPDGKRLAFASSRDGPFNIYQKDFGGSGAEQALLKSDRSKSPADWSPDGRHLLYVADDPKTRYDLWVLPLDPPGKPMPFLQTAFNETQGQFSPGPGEARWVAYTSDESGRSEIYVQRFSAAPSGAGDKFQVSTAGGLQPRWRGDGKELFYIAPDGKLMAVEVKTSPKFDFGIPKALFAPRIYGTSITTGFRYAVAADGKRFLINTVAEAEGPETAPVTVVLNWTAGLKR
jgi:Tol biopolymer transport system component